MQDKKYLSFLWNGFSLSKGANSGTWSTIPVSASGLGTDTFLLYLTFIFWSLWRNSGIFETVRARWDTIRSSSGWTAGRPLIKCKSTLPKVSQAPCLQSFHWLVIEMTSCKNNDKLLYYLTCQSLALALVSFQLHQCKRSSCDQHHSQLGQCGSQKSKGWTHLFLQLLPW